MPSLAAKRVSRHTIRHTTATHLLRAGVTSWDAELIFTKKTSARETVTEKNLTKDRKKLAGGFSLTSLSVRSWSAAASYGVLRG